MLIATINDEFTHYSFGLFESNEEIILIIQQLMASNLEILPKKGELNFKSLKICHIPNNSKSTFYVSMLSL